MQIASVLTPLSDYNLKLASQLGVTDVVIRFPGLDYRELLQLKSRIGAFGLRISVVEGYLPMEAIKTAGSARDAEIEKMKLLIRNMGQADIRLLCYNFMVGSDWSRTSFKEHGRGGALVSGFDVQQAAKGLAGHSPVLTAEELWQNLEYFLKQLLPVAEASDVVLTMHPDDPPLPSVGGMTRIMHKVEAFERLVSLAPSRSNAICFCQGTFAEMGVDIPSTIRRLGSHIRYVHFRDIRGTATNFVETFHDNGQTNMVQAMRAYRQVGFKGPMRPDHVPQLIGEEDGEPGYTMLGRLFAFGYLRGLIQAVSEEPKAC